MSEETKWMPDAERLCMAFDLSDQAWEEISDGERGPDGSWLDPLRAVVREAVERALAEQEARHKREEIEARLDTLAGFGDCVCPVSELSSMSGKAECACCREIYRLRAELAALEVKP